MYAKLSAEHLQAQPVLYCLFAWTFIDETWPILRSAHASAKKAITKEKSPSIPVNVLYTILDREVEAIRAFLEGRTDHHPSDEKLCDWVQFCYTFQLYDEGRALFALVDPTQVHPWFLDRTTKLARICELKADQHG